MKWDRRTCIAIFSSITLVASGMSMHALVVRLRSINRCVVTVDNRLSADVSAHITRAIEEHAYAGKSYTAIAAAVIKEFPCVDDITFHHCAPGVLHSAITSVDPLIQINDSYVVSSSGSLLALDNFSPTLLHTLHTMEMEHCNENDCMPRSFITTVQALTPSLLDTYDAQWVDENKLVLHDKKDSHFSLICNAQKLPDAHLLAQCQQLKNNVSDNKISKTKQWSADLRFEHQIVLAVCQGGVVHG